MTGAPALQVALCSSLDLEGASGGIPEWVHLLPAGALRTVDGRGPYFVKSLQAVADASLAQRGKLPIDECHAIDKAQPMGLAAPARGWVVALQVRDDGLWGRVEWTSVGRQLLSERAYQGISPAIVHRQNGEVVQVLRASLTNTPNMVGLTALHTQEFRAPPPAGRQVAKPLNEEDQMVIALFNLDEAEYRQAMAKAGFAVGG